MECKKLKEKEEKPTSGCYESNIGISTNRYCYMINERAAEETCKTLQEGNGFICNVPCRDARCDIEISAKIGREKYLQGVSKFICKNDGTERNTGCYKGEKIDESKYIKQASISCNYSKCAKYFDALKKKNN